jgi:GNAT superfamily N-acetyltransferase
MRSSLQRDQAPIRIHKGYVPGVIGRVIELHGTYYHAHWGFGVFFEVKVANGLSEFINRYDDQRDGLWTAAVNGRVEGSIVIDGAHATQEGAHLRWFIISDTLRGQGAGNQLIDAAIDFCRIKKYPRVYLWTFEGLHAARHLYEQAGFILVEQHRGTQWGTEVEEQRFELRLA